MEKQSVGKRFYQGQQLVTQVQGPNFSQTLLFAGGRCLSERQSAGNPVNPGLVATEFKGSVIDVVHGNDVTRHTYTPYGYSPAVSAKFPRPGFNGALLELVTGCYMLGNGTRGYDPRIMRFTSPDRLSPFLKGGINSYAYCEGDPVNYSDPTGQGKNPVQNFKQHSVALAKKRLRGAVRRKYDNARFQKVVKIKQKRAPYLNAYEDASELLQSLTANAHGKHEVAFQNTGHLPNTDPQKVRAMDEPYRRIYGLFDGASDPEINERLRAVIDFGIKKTRLGSEELKSFLHLSKRAAAAAHNRNHLDRIAQMVRQEVVNESAFPIAALTPPTSPER